MGSCMKAAGDLRRRLRRHLPKHLHRRLPRRKSERAEVLLWGGLRKDRGWSITSRTVAAIPEGSVARQHASPRALFAPVATAARTRRHTPQRTCGGNAARYGNAFAGSLAPRARMIARSRSPRTPAPAPTVNSPRRQRRAPRSLSLDARFRRSSVLLARVAVVMAFRLPLTVGRPCALALRFPRCGLLGGGLPPPGRRP
jgi:hypothetical protein